jgi:hypothetical protein
MSTYALLAHTQANAAAGGALSAATADNMFAKATVNVKLVDSTTMVTLSATNTWQHSATGNYQFQAVVGYGCPAGGFNVGARAGLYNVTSSAFVPYAGGANEMIGVSGLIGSAGVSVTQSGFIEIAGRYTVSSTADHYGIYMAGKGSGTLTWYSSTLAQGIQATSVTSGTKAEVYKLVQIIKE